MTVLVTRPNADAQPVIERLERAGLRVLHTPMMQIVSVVVSDSERDVLYRARRCGRAYLLFTSANGVRACMEQLPDVADIPCFCVGEQTAQCAEGLAFRTICTAGGDVCRLIEMIEGSSLVGDAALFHFRGQDHRGELVLRLQEKRYNIRAICAYNAVQETALSEGLVDALKAKEVRGVLFYSARTARIFESLLGVAGVLSSCAGMTAYGLSREVLEVLQESWKRQVFPSRISSAALEAEVIADEE